MNTIEDYKAFVQDFAFPTSLEKLRQCETPDDITRWRKVVSKTLNDKTVKGEVIDNLPFEDP